MSHWQTSRYSIDLTQPRVMGIVNLTPDSFSDGGQHAGHAAAIAHCEQLVREGADILDLGAESSRPGAATVPAEEELARLLPVLRAAVTMDVPVSVDTCKPQVMREALDLGADIINDIRALREPGAMDVVAGHACCGVVLMHMHRDPATMQVQPMRGDVVPQVRAFLHAAVAEALARGIAPQRIALDPGVGFGKTVEQNFALLARQAELGLAQHPWLVGWSRKSALAAAMGLKLADMAALHNEDRVAPSVAAAILAVERGARIVRVHDVRHTVAALGVWRAMHAQQATGEQDTKA